MVSLKESVLLDLIKNNESKIASQWDLAKENLKKLDSQIQNCANMDVKKFYSDLIKEVKRKNFITLDRQKINYLIKTLKDVPPTGQIFQFNKRKNKVNLSELLILTMGYSKRRSDFYPTFYSSLGVKACVYCNAQYALTHQRNNNGWSSRYELDHVFDKGKYPYLCVSLFNLVPICSTCNKIKEQSTIGFDFYTKEDSPSEYCFKITAASVAKYLLFTKRKEDLRIKLDVRTTKTNNLEQCYSIESLYQTQQDLAEEIVIKARVYNEKYRQMLTKSFEKLNLTSGVTERVILGNYISESDVHKRPMTKFMQDIAIDLGFLKR